MELNLRLRDLRKKLKIRQADVAKHLGVSISTYTKYETGNNQPDLNMLIKLSKYYNVSSDYLLGLKNSLFVDNISLDKLELLDLYDHLSPEDKFKLLEIAKTFVNIPILKDSTQDDFRTQQINAISPKKGA